MSDPRGHPQEPSDMPTDPLALAAWTRQQQDDPHRRVRGAIQRAKVAEGELREECRKMVRNERGEQR